MLIVHTCSHRLRYSLQLSGESEPDRKIGYPATNLTFRIDWRWIDGSESRKVAQTWRRGRPPRTSCPLSIAEWRRRLIGSTLPVTPEDQSRSSNGHVRRTLPRTRRRGACKQPKTQRDRCWLPIASGSCAVRAQILRLDPTSDI